MHTQFLAAVAALSANALASLSSAPSSNAAVLIERQSNPNSTCSVFGIDFQNGGSYFINTNSQADFTAVSQFEGCNNDTASIMLVNDDTSDEYECTAVPTVPDDVSQMSTCPIMKSQITSGNWSILTLGDNGNGNPYAYQRDFMLQAGPQETVTATVTVPFTLTTQSTSTVECKADPKRCHSVLTLCSYLYPHIHFEHRQQRHRFQQRDEGADLHSSRCDSLRNRCHHPDLHPLDQDHVYEDSSGHCNMYYPTKASLCGPMDPLPPI